MKIGVLDIEIPEGDRKQLADGTVALSATIFDLTMQMQRANLRDRQDEKAKIGRQYADAIRDALLQAYFLGAVRAHVGSKSAMQESHDAEPAPTKAREGLPRCE